MKFNLLYFCYLFASPLLVWSQDFQSYTAKSKVGIQINDVPITRAKFESVFFEDDSIATAYKGKKVFFVNMEGKVIYKTKKAYADKFFQSNAILHKKGKYGAINRDGDYIIPLKRLTEPVKMGNMLWAVSASYEDVTYTKKYDLYDRNGSVERTVDNIEFEEGWILVKDHWTESYTYTKKRLLRKDIKKTGYKSHYFYNVYNSSSSKCIVKKADKYKIKNQLIEVKEPKGDLSLHSLTEGEILRGKYKSFVIGDEAIYALTDTVSANNNLHLYSLEGNLLRDDLGYIGTLDSTRHIFTKDSLQFIGDPLGSQLSPLVSGFGEYGEGFRVVFLGGRYTHMNDETYELLPRTFPVLAKKHYTSSGGGGGRRRGRFIGKLITGVRNFGRRMGNIGRNIIGKPSKPLHIFTYGYSSSYAPDVELIESGHAFSDGLARVCLYTHPNEADSSQVLQIYKNVALEYNFITTKGELLNNEHYSNATNFHNGHSWVYKDAIWKLIDTTGTAVEGEAYSNVEHQENGYFIVVKDGLYGVINENYRTVAACQYQRIELKDKKFVEAEGEQRIVHEIPK